MRLERRVIYSRFSLLVSRQQPTRDRFVQDARNLFLTRLGRKKVSALTSHQTPLSHPLDAILHLPSTSRLFINTHTHTHTTHARTTYLSLYRCTPVEVLGVLSPRKSMTTASDTYWEHRRLDVEAAKRERLAKL